MNETHILRAFDEALATLSARVTLMSEKSVVMLEGAVAAFEAGDAEAARVVIAADMEVDRLQEEVNREVMSALARFQPIAVDLRQILAVEHMAGNLERVADHAKNIAKRTITTGVGGPSPDVLAVLSELAAATSQALRSVIRALKREDAAASAQIVSHDGRIDALYDDLFHTAVAKLKGGGDSALGDVQALFVGKSLERIGDHATNIAEEIRYMTIGEQPSATRRRPILCRTTQRRSPGPLRGHASSCRRPSAAAP
jgi:phosphate transport system protein